MLNLLLAVDQVEVTLLQLLEDLVHLVRVREVQLLFPKVRREVNEVLAHEELELGLPVLVVHVLAPVAARAWHPLLGLADLLSRGEERSLLVGGEDHWIVSAEYDVVMLGVILVLLDPLALELLHLLLVLGLRLADPSRRREPKQELAEILQPSDDVLALFDLAPHVDNLFLQVLLNDLHGLPLDLSLVRLLFLVVGLQLVSLDELQ